MRLKSEKKINFINSKLKKLFFKILLKRTFYTVFTVRKNLNPLEIKFKEFPLPKFVSTLKWNSNSLLQISKTQFPSHFQSSRPRLSRCQSKENPESLTADHSTSLIADDAWHALTYSTTHTELKKLYFHEFLRSPADGRAKNCWKIMKMKISWEKEEKTSRSKRAKLVKTKKNVN